MTEKEIIGILQYQINNKDTDVYIPINYDAIQGILDLYNKEKERNKEFFKTLCNYEDTLGYYETEFEKILDKYNNLTIDYGEINYLEYQELQDKMYELSIKIYKGHFYKEIKEHLINDYISKDKIRELLDKYDEDTEDDHYYLVENIEKLL